MTNQIEWFDALDAGLQVGLGNKQVVTSDLIDIEHQRKCALYQRCLRLREASLRGVGVICARKRLNPKVVVDHRRVGRNRLRQLHLAPQMLCTELPSVLKVLKVLKVLECASQIRQHKQSDGDKGSIRSR